jgi:hypothetical protein
VNSPLGTGVVGHGQGRGGWFEALGAGGYGLEGVGPARGVSGSGADGVYGTGTNAGVHGDGTSYGVVGTSYDGFGVWGSYATGFIPGGGPNAGVYGISGSTNAGSAGVRGENTSGHGVHGISTAGVGVRAESSTNDGLVASSAGANKSGIWAYSTNASGFGLACSNSGGGVAFRADGLAQVRTLQILGADLAEAFPVREERVEPGTVMVVDDRSPGRLRVSNEPYSRRVAGVVSGANGLEAGVVLEGHSFDKAGEAAVALSGRVWVKCDATRSPIRVGDLLTTADRDGYAMVASDRDRAYGAVLGKAMSALPSGTGLVLVLVSLQ